MYSYTVHLQAPDIHTIKYIGSKKKIIPYILRAVGRCPNVRTVLDGFSGSCRVSQALSMAGYSVTSNDISSYSYTLAQCFLRRAETAREAERVQVLIAQLNAIEGHEGWFSKKYGGSPQDIKKPFQLHNMKKVDGILREMENTPISETERHIVLTSLLLALDKVDSTLGHQSSYLKNWAARSFKTMELRVPPFCNPYNTRHSVRKDDVFAVAGQYHDLAYFDPPYGSNNAKMPASRVRYKCYYHIWETIVKNDRPETFGASERRVDSRDIHSTNPFEDFRKTGERYNSDIAIESLLRRTNSRYVLFSYNSNGRTSVEALMSILEESLEIIHTDTIPYRKNIMAYMNSTENWQNALENYEILVLGRKK